MNILCIAPNQIDKYNWGHELFRREIARQHNVIFFGPSHTKQGISLFEHLNNIGYDIHDFDFVFTHGLKYTRKIKDIFNIPKDVTKVHYVVDYFQSKGDFKGRASEQHDFINKYEPNIVFSVYHNSIKPLKKNTCCKNIFCLPFSACTEHYKRNDKIIKKNQVVACFSRRVDAYPNRDVALKNLKFNNIPTVTQKNRFEYIDAINSSKITLGVNDIFKSLNMRVTETLACGGFLLTNRPNYIERLGLVAGKHFQIYDNFSDMLDKIKYYFEHDRERLLIELAGMHHVLKYHSCKVRVNEMIDIIKRLRF